MFSKEDSKILDKVGDNIRNLRKSKGMSQHDLAIEAEIPKNQIGRIERAEINTTLLTLHKIAKALNISLNNLIDIRIN